MSMYNEFKKEKHVRYSTKCIIDKNVRKDHLYPKWGIFGYKNKRNEQLAKI